MSPEVERMCTEFRERCVEMKQFVRESHAVLQKALTDMAKSTDQRFTDLEARNAASRNRLDTIEGRLLAVEKRLNMPPAA